MAIRPEGWLILNQLRPGQRESISHWLKKLSPAETSRRIHKEFGLEISAPVLKYFEQSQLLGIHLAQAVAATRQLESELAQANSREMDAESVSLAAQVYFELRAIVRDDLDGFARLRRLRQEDQALELRRKELARRCQSEIQRALEQLGQELHNRPDCLDLFKALQDKLLKNPGKEGSVEMNHI